MARAMLTIELIDSRVLKATAYYTELSWKVDVKNTCNELFEMYVTFTFYDKDDFEIDSDFKLITVPANGIGKARGRSMIESEKARHIHHFGARVSTNPF